MILMYQCPVERVRQRLTENMDKHGFLEGLMAKWRSFSICDVGVFKLCLLSLGMAVGVSFTNTLKKRKSLLWLLFGVSYLYVIWRMFFYEEG